MTHAIMFIVSIAVLLTTILVLWSRMVIAKFKLRMTQEDLHIKHIPDDTITYRLLTWLHVW